MFERRWAVGMERTGQGALAQRTPFSQNSTGMKCARVSQVGMTQEGHTGRVAELASSEVPFECR